MTTKVFSSYNIYLTIYNTLVLPFSPTENRLFQGHDNVFGQTLIYAVLPEFYAILGLVCAYLA